MRLFLDIGQYDRSTNRTVRGGSCVAVAADTVSHVGQGVLFVCAEAVPGSADGEQAARAATTALGDACYAADLASPPELLREGLNAANLAVRASGDHGRAAAVTALLLHGQQWHVGHAGHLRVWRYRELQLKQLTRDHVLPRASRQTEVTNACGYGDTVVADYHHGDLQEGDIFLVTTAGVHNALDGASLLGVLQTDATAQQMAEALVQRAFAAHTPAYAAACVARVEKVPQGAFTPASAMLPVIAPPAPGDDVDGFAIKKLLLKSRRFRLYQACDAESGDMMLLRFPDPSRKDGAQALLREAAVARRVDNPYLMRPIALRPGRRTALYAVTEHRHVESLVKRLRRKHFLAPAEALPLGDQLLSALEALHQQGVVHGDVRPHNLLYDKSRRQIYLLGFAASMQGADGHRDPRSGTLNYRAPELFESPAATERSDIYAAGVTLYRMLTDRYPYGKVRIGADWTRLSYAPARELQSDLPPRVDEVLARACAVDPAERYASIAQFAAALSAATIPEPAPAATPVAGSPEQRAQSRWSWGFAAAVAAALAAYLYLTLR